MRLREPLSHYTSFFVWGVAPLQGKQPAKYGHNFSEWLASGVGNLQASLLLSSGAAMSARYAPLRSKERRDWLRQWAANGPARRPRAADLAMAELRAYTVVGVAERFWESMLLVLREVGGRGFGANDFQERHEAPIATTLPPANRYWPYLSRYWPLLVPGAAHARGARLLRARGRDGLGLVVPQVPRGASLRLLSHWTSLLLLTSLLFSVKYT